VGEPDEGGGDYLPIDKFGADGLFQVISQRYERGSTFITSNRAFKKWPEIFNLETSVEHAFIAGKPAPTRASTCPRRSFTRQLPRRALR
jgi:hypothetical protein